MMNSEFSFSCLSIKASKSSLLTRPLELINFSNLLFMILSISFFKSAKVDNAPVMMDAESFKKKLLFFYDLELGTKKRE